MKFPIPSEAKTSLMVVPAHLEDVTRGVGPVSQVDIQSYSEKQGLESEDGSCQESPRDPRRKMKEH